MKKTTLIFIVIFIGFIGIIFGAGEVQKYFETKEIKQELNSYKENNVYMLNETDKEKLTYKTNWIIFSHITTYNTDLQININGQLYKVSKDKKVYDNILCFYSEYKLFSEILQEV